MRELLREEKLNTQIQLFGGLPFFRFLYTTYLGLPKWHGGKEFVCQLRRLKRRGFEPWLGKIPWSRKWHPVTVFWPGKSHGQRSLAG